MGTSAPTPTFMKRMAIRSLLARLGTAFIVLAAFIGPPAPARADAPLYVVVPFGEPGDMDPLSRDATTNLTMNLSDHRIRSAASTPIDAIEAVGSAGKLCSQYRGDGILVSQLKFEQSKERNLTGFIPVIGGVVSASGVFDASPLRARLKLFLIDCNGHVAWRTYTTSNKVHHGTNVSAGMTQIMENALRDAVDQFANRR